MVWRMNSFVSPAARRTNLRNIEAVVTEGSQPLSRIKSSSAVTNAGKFFLFGGFDEDDRLDGNVYILDIHSNVWSTHQQDQVYREGHSSLFIGKDPSNDQETILVYGGVPEESNNAHFNHSQLVKYFVDSDTWESVEDQGPAIPEPRSRHAACLSQDGTKMFISGGLYKDDLNSPYDDLRILDIKTGIWEGTRNFICRFDHYITHHDGKIWSLGGLTKDMAHTTDISWFDIQTNISGSIRINDLPKFHGDHIFMNSKLNSSLLLDVVVPLFSVNDTVEPCIGLYDLNTLRWHAVLTGAFDPLMGHKWKHTFIHDSKLYLLGYPVMNQNDDPPFDFNLKTIIGLDLADLGVFQKPNRKRKFDDDSMASDFKDLLSDNSLSDFQIIGIEGFRRPSLNSEFIESKPTKTTTSKKLDTPFHSDVSHEGVFIKSKPLKVHTTILYARWPHFRRIISSGMQETSTRQLFIPEPIAWLESFVEYLYTNEVSSQDLDLISGLLILSNLYEVPKLRKLCLDRIYSKGFKVENVINIWSRAKYINEEILAHNAANFCSKNWDIVIRSDQFEDLPKDELVRFCRDVKVGTPQPRYNSPIPRDRSFNLNHYDRDYSNVEHGPSFGTFSQYPNFGFPDGEGPKTNDDEYDDQGHSEQYGHYGYYPQGLTGADFRPSESPPW